MVGSKKKKKKKVCHQHFVLNIHKKFKGERERERDMDVWGASE